MAVLNSPAILLFSVYILLGCYLLILVFQRLTYTLKSPLPLIIMRFILLLMILICCISCNLLYLYSCFVDTNTASTNPYYKYPFYIEFYFKNISWSLSVILMAYSIKFKRPCPHSDKPNISINDQRSYDAPPPRTPYVRPKKKLNINDVDLWENEKQKRNGNEDIEQKYEQKQDQNPLKLVEVPSKTESKTFSLKPPQTVFDNNKEHQNQGFFVISLFVIGIGSLLFNIIWYSLHTDYIDLFVYTEQHKMPRWYFPFNHRVNTLVIIINRAFLSFWLVFQAIYLYKEFYNYLVVWWLSIALMVYWLCFGLLITTTIHGDGDGFQFIAPFLYYVIFFSLHLSDAQRDQQPTSQSVFVNADKLELFYRFWAARPYKSTIAPNMFCFGPSPSIEEPTKASIILLGGWGNIKEDYDRIAYLLSQSRRNVIVIDYRGIGETDLWGVNAALPDNRNPYSAEQYAQDVFDLIKQLFPHTTQLEDSKDSKDEDSDDDSRDATEYDSNDEFQKKDHKSSQHKVYLLGLSMGANVALQCALHPDANRYLQGIALCSVYDNVWEKPHDFDSCSNQILTGNALHYGWCEAQKKYIGYAHSESYLSSWWNRIGLRTFYSWRMSAHPYYCCNFSKDIMNVNEVNVNEPSLDRERGVSKWFNNVSLSLRIGGWDKHRVVYGIERQTYIAEDGFDISKIMRHLVIPTFIYHGSQDKMIHPNSAELLQRTLGPNACREECKEGGHNFWFENQSLFVRTIADWMNDEEDLYVANN